MNLRTLSAKALAIVLTLLMVLPLDVLAATSEPVLPDPGSPGMNKQQQEQLGLQAVGEVYKQMPVLPDSNPVTQYVQQLGKKLEGVIPQDRSWPYQFHVIPAADINAFALPGGPIFINLATIQAAANEGQLIAEASQPKVLPALGQPHDGVFIDGDAALFQDAPAIYGPGELALGGQVVPPVVVAEHGMDAKRGPQLGQRLGPVLGRDGTRLELVTGGKVAEQHHRVGAERIGDLDDPLDAAERHRRPPRVQVGNDRDR